MDPKVLRELLTHGHGGSKVDEEASRGGFPLWQSAGTGLQIGSPRNRSLWRRKYSKKDLAKGFAKYEIYRRKNGHKAVFMGPT